jgi:hypothetical protein
MEWIELSLAIKKGRTRWVKAEGMLLQIIVIRGRFWYNCEIERFVCVAKRFIRLWRINMANPG